MKEEIKSETDAADQDTKDANKKGGKRVKGDHDSDMHFIENLPEKYFHQEHSEHHNAPLMHANMQVAAK